MKSLRRITSGGRYLPEIDGLRFIAITSVLVYHVAMMTEIDASRYLPSANPLKAFLGAMLFNGSRGVPIFFAISGFILGLPFAQQYLSGAPPVSLKKYFLRRVTRLEPPYIASQCIRLYPVMVAKGLSFVQVLPHFVAGLLYIHLLVYRTMPLVQFVGWSLELEIQFYVLAPFLTRFIFRKSPLQRRALMYGYLLLHGILVYFVCGPKSGQLGGPATLATYVNISFLYWSRFFLAGFAVAELYVTTLPRLENHWVWDVISIPCWFLPFALTERTWSFFGPFILVLTFIGAFKGVLARSILRTPFISIVGGMCYSIYLTHSLALQGFYAIYMRLLPGIHGFRNRLVLGEILILPLLIIVGAAFFLLIERPCMDKDWPRKVAAWARARFEGSPAAVSD